MAKIFRPNVRQIAFFLNFYPPYLGAGVRIRMLKDNPKGLEIRMKLRWWNRNALGTQFGGSLYSMCDPFYVLLLMDRLGPEYVIWDKAASIWFLKPGRGTMRAVFEIPDERVEQIRADAETQGKTEPVFRLNVTDEAGEVIAQLEKTLYVRKKR